MPVQQSLFTDTEANRAVDIYKAYLGDLGNIGSRHSDVNKFYVSLLSALFVLLGLTTGAANYLTPLFRDGVYTLSIALSIAWWLHLTSYATLFRVKFTVLGAIERDLRLRPQPFTEEFPHLRRYVPVSLLERLVPILLTLPFLLVLRQFHSVWSWVFVGTDVLLVLLMVWEGLTWFRRRSRTAEWAEQLPQWM